MNRQISMHLNTCIENCLMCKIPVNSFSVFACNNISINTGWIGTPDIQQTAEWIKF